MLKRILFIFISLGLLVLTYSYFGILLEREWDYPYIVFKEKPDLHLFYYTRLGESDFTIKDLPLEQQPFEILYEKMEENYGKYSIQIDIIALCLLATGVFSLVFSILGSLNKNLSVIKLFIYNIINCVITMVLFFFYPLILFKFPFDLYTLSFILFIMFIMGYNAVIIILLKDKFLKRATFG